MREAGQSVYPNDIDPLIFYQDPNIEKHPLLAHYYELINQNKFTEAKQYLQSVDLDYYGSWLLNKIENRLYTVEQHIPDVIGEKPKLTIHKWPEPANSEYTEECFCWTDKGYMVTEHGNIDIDENQQGTSNNFNSGYGTFWHCYINVNAMHTDAYHMTRADNFYFQRYPSGHPNYGSLGLNPTTISRTVGNIYDLGITAYEIASLQSQEIIIPVYLDEIIDEYYTIRLKLEDITIEEIGTNTRYSFTQSAGLYYEEQYESGSSEDVVWTIPTTNEHHYYLFAGIGPVFGNAQGTTTITNVLYFGLINNYFVSSQQKGVKFQGVGLDLAVLKSSYDLEVNKNFIPENPK